MIAFILGSSRFILVCSTAIWYFGRNENTIQGNPITTSIAWLFIYHAGSVAFGSLLIALIWLLQIIVEYISVVNLYSGKNQQHSRS